MTVVMTVWLVGWAQDLDEWGVHSAHTTEARAREAAEAIVLQRHFEVWRSMGKRPDWPRAGHDIDWGCCRPQVVPVDIHA